MNSDPHRTLSAGYVYAFLCSFCSALMIILIKWVEHSLPALSVLLLSQGIAGVTLSAIVFTGDGRDRLKKICSRDWFRMAGLSLLYLVAYWTLFAALRLLDPTVATFLGRTEVLVTILFAMLFLGERFSRYEIAGSVFVLAGLVTIRYTGGVEISRGFVLCMISALFWGVTEGLAKVLVRTVGPLLFAWTRSWMLFICFLPLAALSGEGIRLPMGAHAWAALIGLSLVGPVLGRLLYMKSLSLIPVSKAALINQLQPVWVAVMAACFLGTWPSAEEWIGGGLILAGCFFLVQRHRARQTVRHDDMK
ncbi:MAG: DMT family transporter [Planctomycetota bacterium]